MRISDWSSDVCSSDLRGAALVDLKRLGDGDLARPGQLVLDAAQQVRLARSDQAGDDDQPAGLHGRTDLAHEVALMLCSSAERRVGKECVSQVQSRWSPLP